MLFRKLLIGLALCLPLVVAAAPVAQNFTNIQPFIDATYDNGTSTLRWLGLWTKYASTTAISATTICLTGDTCRTTWPTGGGGSGTVSTSTNESSGFLSYWTSNSATPALLGKVATGTITCTGTASCGTGSFVVGSNLTITGSAGTSASSTLLTDSNTFSGTLNQFSNTIKVATLAGLIGGNGGTLYSFASSSLFGYTPPSNATTLTIAGTANQITSSAGAQDLTANRTWTLTLPAHVIFPGNFQATNSTTTNATTTSLYVTGAFALNGPLGTDNTGRITASTTGIVTAGTGISLDNATRQIFGGSLAITNSGVISGSCTGGTTCSGTNPLAINSFLWPWAIATNYGTTTNSTTTPTWFKTNLFASSTLGNPSIVDNLVTINSTSTNATTTTFAITGAGATNCNGTSALTTTSTGVVGCTAQPQGTVTAVSVATANGFAGSSSGGATPALTLTTTITGLLKGSGTAISAAALTDFPTQAANTVLVNQTAGAAAPTALATSTFGTYLYGQGTPGQVLMWSGAAPLWAATSSVAAGSASSTLLGDSNTFSGTLNQFTKALTFVNATSTGSLSVSASTTIAGVLNIGGQLNANLAAIIASTTLTGNTLLGSATSTGSLYIMGSTTLGAVLNGAGLGSCTGGTNALTWSAGVFGCQSISAAGGAYPFTPSTDGGINTSATSTPIQGTNPGLGLDVSATSWYGIGGRLLAYASSTNNTTIFGIGAGGNNATTSPTSAKTTAIGTLALNALTTGVDNTAVGYNSLPLNLTAGNNTAVGSSALSKTTAADNTGVGLEVLRENTTGIRNTAVGSNALRSKTAQENVAVGYSALVATGLGNRNVGVGSSVGLAISNGNNNILVGYQAGGSITTGYDNIILEQGIDVGGSAITTGGGNIGLGYDVKFPAVTTNRMLNIGNFLFANLPATTSVTSLQVPTSGAFGIGSSSPSAKLSVHTNNGDTAQLLFAIGSSTATATSTLLSVTNTGTLSVNTPNVPQLFVSDNSTGAAFRYSNGHLYIASTTSSSATATTTPAAIDINTNTGTSGLFVGTTTNVNATGLAVNGTIFLAGVTTSGSTQAGDLCISATNQVINDSVACIVSARRYKQDIHALSPSLDEVMKLQAVSFYYKPSFNGSMQTNPNYNGEQVGFIADDVQKIDPRLTTVVTSGPETGLVASVRYQNMVALLVSATQEQQRQIQGIVAGTYRSAEQNWMWGAIALLALWNLALTLKRRK